jgi:hypothetical protein
MDPNTIYGISKLAGERLCEYYFEKYGVDVRSIRYPGIISFKSPPGGGTTDYAIAIFHSALRGESYSCFLEAETTLPMIYMPDAIRATVSLMDAPAEQLTVRSSYNVAGLSFNPRELAAAIKQNLPEFQIHYAPDSRQAIAASWPQSLDDSQAGKTGAGKRNRSGRTGRKHAEKHSCYRSRPKLHKQRKQPNHNNRVTTMDMRVFDLFKIGVGPSSSPVGPMVAARRFLVEAGNLQNVTKVQAALYGSLALTGSGHATDKAVLLGLMGETPQDVAPDTVEDKLTRLSDTHQMRLLGEYTISFNPATDIIWHMQEVLPGHPNGMKLTLTRQDGSVHEQVLLYRRWLHLHRSRTVQQRQSQH